MIGREIGDKILVPNPFILDPGKKIPKKRKIKKTYSGIIFSQNGMRYAVKEKKNLVPNSVNTRPGQENSE